jgi:hypothetical protein
LERALAYLRRNAAATTMTMMISRPAGTATPATMVVSSEAMAPGTLPTVPVMPMDVDAPSLLGCASACSAIARQQRDKLRAPWRRQGAREP